MSTRRFAVPVMEAPTCQLPKQKPVKANPVKVLFQKLNPVGCKAVVRYDARQNQWSLLNDKHEPKQHFEAGVMENVEFCTADIKEYSGCGPASSKTIGLAKGELFLHRQPGSLVGARNLSFKDGRFVDQDGAPISTASKIALMPGRRAIYWE